MILKTILNKEKIKVVIKIIYKHFLKSKQPLQYLAGKNGNVNIYIVHKTTYKYNL